jgi:DNA polymerase-3 subunit alpha (Gram-positive type)
MAFVAFAIVDSIKNDSRPIQEILSNEFEGACTVEGEVFDVSFRVVGKNNSYLFQGGIYDGTSSMYFKFFSDKNITLEAGSFVKFQGRTERDSYKNNELVMGAVKMARIAGTATNSRIDEAPVKRVELQTHTFMSTLSGAMDVSNLVKEVKRLGQTAVAVTDRSTVIGLYEGYKAAKKEGVKLISGLTTLVVDDQSPLVFNPVKGLLLDQTYVVFDVETTGLSVVDDYVIEVGAMKFKLSGSTEEPQIEILDQMDVFIRSPKRVPAFITELTGITNEKLDEDGVSLEAAVAQFDAFVGDYPLVAHNMKFDRDMMKTSYRRVGQVMPNNVLIDTLAISRCVNKELKGHGLDKLAKRYEIKLENHHRADQDVRATAYVLMYMVHQLVALEIICIDQINDLMKDPEYYKTMFPYQVTLLAKNQVGLKNLYKIISQSHTESLYKRMNVNIPVITKTALNQLREGILIGSGSHLGQLFEYALNKTPEMVLEDAAFYDYIEIQPQTIASHMVATGFATSIESIDRSWKTIYDAAQTLGKMIVGTGHVNCLQPEDNIHHNILLYSELPPGQMSHEKRKGRQGQLQGECHLRTTGEMLTEYPYLSSEETYRIVVENSILIADQCEMLSPFPSQLFVPNIDRADERLIEMTLAKAKEIYGNPLPNVVKKRLEKELRSITTNKFSGIYLISRDLVKNSHEAGYLVGSRGSVGSSVVATMAGITEVNALEPHYACTHCHWNLFFQHPEARSGYDLPNELKYLLVDEPELEAEEKYSDDAKAYFKTLLEEKFGARLETVLANQKDLLCPECSQKMIKDGHDIPFETFLGFKGDKVPDIDLNFASEYQSHAHDFTKVLFGEKNVFRAGTVATVADKTAFGFVNNYSINNGLSWSNAEVSRVASKITGSKRSTGQHPGGIVVVPDNMDVEDVTPVQYPANNPKEGWKTTHFDYHAFEANLLKLDILGHEAPSVQRFLEDFTGIDPRTVPPTDKKVLKLFYDAATALGVDMEDMKLAAKTGTLGLPEMGTQLVQDVLLDAKPRGYADLVSISGLTHGTGVWKGNAKDLIINGTCLLKDVIDTRDGIMLYLINKKMEESEAFKIMESVRKGKKLNPEWEELMRKHDVPEWYIASCNKIEYMFPKAHAAAYVLDALRIGWYKVYHPIEFYAAIFSAKYNTQDSTEIMKPVAEIKQRIQDLTVEAAQLNKAGEKNAAKKPEELIKTLQMVLEAKLRGIKFGTLNVYKSHSTHYQIIDDVLIPPFSAIDGIGDVVSKGIYEGAKTGPFKGLDDFVARTGANKTSIAVLRNLGCLEGIEEKQHLFF